MKFNIFHIAAFALCLVLVGCATNHIRITETTAVLGPPFLSCSGNQACEMVRNWEVPNRPGTTQLTPIGCVLHTLVTGGHVAWECRAVSAKGGRWLWK